MTIKHIKSLREFIDALKEVGELVDVRAEVDWNLEIGAITRRCYETGAPAPLFSKITGIEHGFRVLGASGGVSARSGQYLARIALALGLAPTTGAREIIESLVAARERKPIPPRIVSSGPCKENRWTGAQIDLFKLPTPLLHDGDGGRFINTLGSFIARTPDGKWTNWSIARAMIVGPTKMAGIVAPFQHLGMIWNMWREQGKPMPFALALGGEPFLPFVSGMPLPAWEDEAAYVGGYFGEAVDVVRCESVPLEAPANAEIVIEGYLSNEETALEGPMGEYAGYITRGEGVPKPVYNVTAVTFRNEAILPISVAGEPIEENHTAWGIPNAAEIVYELRKAGLPVATAWSPFESANNWYVIAMQRNWRKLLGYGNDRLCRQIGDVLFHSKAGAGTPKYLVVNDDIDITNIREVAWAFATRNAPGERGETLWKDETNQPLVPYFKPGEKATMRGTKVIYACMPPDEWGNEIPATRASFKHNYTKELRDRVIARWREYGFNGDVRPVEGALERQPL